VRFLTVWLGIRMNLKLVVLILTSHLLASPLMYLLCVKFVKCSDHDSSSCPYYIPSDGLARISNMIETMNTQRVELETKMREFDLSWKANFSFSSSKLDVCLCVMVCLFLL